MKYDNVTLPSGIYSDMQMVRLMANDWFVTIMEQNNVRTFPQFCVVCKKLKMKLHHEQVEIKQLNEYLAKWTRGFNDDKTN